MTRREVVGALLALFGGVVLPRDVIRVVRPQDYGASMAALLGPPQQEINAMFQRYFMLTNNKPSIGARLEAIFPDPSGPTIVQVRATKEEMARIGRGDEGVLQTVMARPA